MKAHTCCYVRSSFSVIVFVAILMNSQPKYLLINLPTKLRRKISETYLLYRGNVILQSFSWTTDLTSAGAENRAWCLTPDGGQSVAFHFWLQHEDLYKFMMGNTRIQFHLINSTWGASPQTSHGRWHMVTIGNGSVTRRIVSWHISVTVCIT